MAATAQAPPNLDQIYQTFPTCEKELIIVPGPSKWLRIVPYVQNILSHNKTFTQLSTRKHNGFFISDLRKLLPEVPDSREGVADLNSKPKGHGCIYVPMPISGNVFLYKNVSSVNQNTKMVIVDSLEDQFESLDKQLDSAVCLNLMLTFKNKTSTELFNDVKNHLQNNSRYKHLKIEFTYCVENELKVPKLKKQNLDGLRNLLTKIINSDQLVEKYKLTDKKFKHFSGDSFALCEQEKVLSLFNIYFPNFETKLEMVPNCDKILDSLLYATNEYAQLKQNSSQYLGEVKWFLENLIPELESTTGILIKNWDRNCFNNLLSPATFYEVDFQIDYLLCTKHNLIAFEVGMTENSSSPGAAVQNKLKQCITKILPTMKFVAATLLEQAPASWFSSSGDKQKQIQSFIDKNLKVVVYMPNTLRRGFEEVLAEPGMNKLKQQLNKSPESLSQLYFLLHRHEVDSKNIVMLKVNSDLGVCSTDNPKQELENCGDAPPYVVYLFGLIVIGKLILNYKGEISELDEAPLDIDDRYKSARDTFLKQQNPPALHPDFLDLILSPQQLSILSEDKPFVWLRGEPGSGKTALLLAKAIQEAKKESVELVIFAIPKSATLLYNFVEKQLNKFKQHTEDFDNWMQKIKLVRCDSITELMDKFHPGGQISNEKGTALLFDEINITQYMIRFFMAKEWETINQFGSPTVLWLAEVVSGDNEIQPLPSFEVYSLNVLYRSSHHISELSSRLIHEHKKVSPTTAVVHGCHTSSQNRVAIDGFSDEEDGTQLIQKAEHMLQSKFSHDRLFICFSDADKIKKKLETCGNIHFVESSYKLVFTGCEAQSVLIIVDENCGSNIFKMKTLILAITRAQYEVGFLVHNNYRDTDDLLKMIRDKNSTPDHVQLYLNLKSGCQFTTPVNVSKKDLDGILEVVCKQLSKQDWSNFIRNLPQRRTETENDSNSFADDHDLIQEIENDSNSFADDHDLIYAVLQSFLKPMEVIQILKWMLNEKTTSKGCDSVKAMGYLFNDNSSDNRRRLLEASNCGTDCFDLVWAIFSGLFLFDLCREGDAVELETTLEVLEQKNAMQRCLNTIQAMVGGTLLCSVCSSSWDRQEQVKKARILFEKGFPNDLLLHRYQRERNALHWAIAVLNSDLVDLLLQDEERKRLFLSEAGGFPYEINGELTGYLSVLEFAAKIKAEHEARLPGSRDASIALDIFNKIEKIVANDQ